MTVEAARSVAPLTGAWIETPPRSVAAFFATVAPLTGAWIETMHKQADSFFIGCRAPHGRVD